MRRSLLRGLTALAIVSCLTPLVWSQAADPIMNIKTATVFVAKFDAGGTFIGWGSGFFVDEGIVVTNKHVVEGGRYFKVFPVKPEGAVNLDCGRELSLSDVKINLNDDAAYMRAFLDCPHGIVQFADHDPVVGAAVQVLGYPARATFDESLQLSTTTGSVIGVMPEGWLITSAYLHSGNSGGPVISGGKVVGVAVAQSTGADGTYIQGYFVPTSVVLKGLLYANNSTFGYTPQAQKEPTITYPNAVLIGDSQHSSSLPSSSSSSSLSSLPSSPFQLRTCARVRKWFTGNKKILDRLNVRLQKEFGFTCAG